jgi:hypothetical protein
MTPLEDAKAYRAQLRRSLMITQRERDTILAALRLWQAMIFKGDGGKGFEAEIEIAENGREGEHARLDAGEIDELIESRINT